MKKIVFSLVGVSLLMLSSSFSLNITKDNTKRAIHCFEFRVTCAGKSGFYDTMQASSWGEATKMINAKYPNCKATQVKQKDC
jgi:hypothetical protein